MLQSFILSLAGLSFSPKHLEFNSHPRELQRAFTARNIQYYNETLLNLSVSITSDNKALIHVALGQHRSKMFSFEKNIPKLTNFFLTEGNDFYACDAGCIDLPVLLSSTYRDFPVKLTEPLTPLLYITSDKEHIGELKHSIHVKEISEAPAHEHHTIALHQYGHSLGGLPTFFWIAIIILIIVFHLFLGKLIYNEYFNSSNVHYERLPRGSGRYAM